MRKSSGWKKKWNRKYPLGGEIWVLKRHRQEITSFIETVVIPQVRREMVEKILGNGYVYGMVRDNFHREWEKIPTPRSENVDVFEVANMFDRSEVKARKELLDKLKEGK